MLKVLEKVKAESRLNYEFPDEKIASNMYFVSLSKALRALHFMEETEKASEAPKNEWLIKEADKIKDLPVLDFDNITAAVANGKKSCDGLFYNYTAQEGERHYLAELKNTAKKELLFLLKSEADDGIYLKVRDSVQTIEKELEFGGTQEGEEIVHNTHFFMVYNGKNNVPVFHAIKLPEKTRVESNERKKQKRAGRMDYFSEKDMNDIYDQFGRKILSLGLTECAEDTFPGDALPRAVKKGKGKGKTRVFSIFSSKDFADIVENGFFDTWSWGEYQEYF